MIYDISIFYVHVHKPSILLMINEQLVDADFIHDTILLTAAVNRWDSDIELPVRQNLIKNLSGGLNLRSTAEFGWG